MSTQGSTQGKSTQSEKVEEIGQLAAGIAHHFNNILGIILVHTELLKEQFEPDSKVRVELSIIERAAERGADLTRNLLAYARKNQYEKKPINLNDSVIKTISLIERPDSKIELQKKLKGDLLFIEGDSSQIKQLLINLAVNAQEAMPDGGILSFQTQNVQIAGGEDDPSRKSANDTRPKGMVLSPGSYVHLTVADTGVGMSQKVQEKIFEPFFTTNERGRRTGLGLAVVYGIVMGHHGEISVHSQPGRGTQFDIYFPAIHRPKA